MCIDQVVVSLLYLLLFIRLSPFYWQLFISIKMIIFLFYVYFNKFLVVWLVCVTVGLTDSSSKFFEDSIFTGACLLYELSILGFYNVRQL